MKDKLQVAGSFAGARWQNLAARERTLILLAALLTALTLLWSLGLAPALRSLRAAPERRLSAEQQLRQMLHLQAQAAQLRERAARPPPQNARALLQELLTQELGQAAQLQWQGDGTARIQLRGAPPAALARWLAQARGQTHAVPQSLRLERAAGADAPTGTPAATPINPPLWSGELTLSLPDGV